MTPMTLAELRSAVAKLPRLPLAKLPTPLDELPRLAAHLGIRLFLKRDDLTGLALGGNKTRMLEFLMAEARRQGADVIVAGAAAQSNFCRQLAAPCAALGLELHLILREVRGPADREPQGNLLLDLLFGAKVTVLAVPAAEQQRQVATQIEKLRRAGRRPYAPMLECSIEDADMVNYGDYVGERYGIPTPEGLQALSLLARLEGILLDPVYTSKALAGLQDLLRQGVIRRGESVVMLHTGGVPALFAYTDALAKAGLSAFEEG